MECTNKTNHSDFWPNEANSESKTMLSLLFPLIFKNEEKIDLHLIADAALKQLRYKLFLEIQSCSPKIFEQIVIDQREFKPEEALKILSICFEIYPVLQHLVETRINFQQRFIEDILNRIRNDWNVISETFGLSAPQITNLQLTNGDFHNNGQVVLILCFDNKKIVYKPRSGSTEYYFYRICEKLNNHLPNQRLPVMKIIDRKQYCWAEYIYYTECLNKKDISNFYFRTGKLLALIWIMQGTDINHENLIATADQPYLIDLEFLFQPKIKQKHSKSYENNVLNTLMLPSWTLVDSSSVSDMSALGNCKASRNQLNKWRDSLHQPKLKGDKPKSQQFVNDVMLGFSEIADLFLHHKKLVKKIFESTIQNNDFPVRFVLKPTRTYADFFSLICDPKSLKSFEIFDTLIEQFITKNKLPITEKKIISSIDIPYYFVTNKSKDLFSADGQIISKNFYELSGFTRSIEMINVLNREQIEMQRKLIQLSFQLISYRYNLSIKPIFRIEPNNELYTNLPDVINLIARTILKNAIFMKDAVLFAHPEKLLNSNYFKISCTNHEFLKGNLGILYVLILIFKMFNTNYLNALILRLIDYQDAMEFDYPEIFLLEQRQFFHVIKEFKNGTNQMSYEEYYNLPYKYLCLKKIFKTSQQDNITLLCKKTYFELTQPELVSYPYSNNSFLFGLAGIAYSLISKDNLPTELTVEIGNI
ncbi:hypothetical protein AR687_24535 [Flavobacteriaceae bacterium CRH]|nr:hypothetical protein AR687_24535 [Flavobacteriaceae bacterium CRH]